MLKIRDAQPADESAWRGLWADYIAFYGVAVPEQVTARTWQRILDPASPIFCRVAECEAEHDIEHNAANTPVGFAVCVLHEGSFSLHPLCYLEDLFVAPAHRGMGIGRAILNDLKQRAAASGWSHLYWHTRQDNPARKLYEEFVPVDDFVRYRLATG
jgi:GNAT superfamily N-acetyltransferase